MAKIIGIDTGIASIGAAYLDLAAQEILSCQVRIFEAAENGKDGASLALPRRLSRLNRRTLDRRARRCRGVRHLLKEHGFSAAALSLPAPSEKTGPIDEGDVWRLRARALTRPLVAKDFFRVLYHINKRRGFQSSRKGDHASERDGGVMMTDARQLKLTLQAAGAPTIGAYLAAQPKKRNNPGQYSHTVTRDLHRAEIDLLFHRQRALGNPLATEVLRQAYHHLAFNQRPLRSCAHLVGNCAFEPGERRAARMSYHNELRLCWERVNHLRILWGGTSRPLTLNEKQQIITLAHAHTALTFRHIRHLLNLKTPCSFNLASYVTSITSGQDWDEIVRKAEAHDFIKLEGYHKIKQALSPLMTEDDCARFMADGHRLDQLVEIMAFHDDRQEILRLCRSSWEPLPLNEQQLSVIMALNLAGAARLSLKAIHALLRPLREGQSYADACQMAGYDHSPRPAGEGSILPPFLPEYGADIRNPLVMRSLSQARKLINALIRTHGVPDHFHIELSRELGLPYKDRKEREREIQKNRRINADLKHQATALFGGPPGGEELVKFRFWKEQQGLCPYSGVEIAIEDLRDSTATQVDHILPYSRSYDNSWANRVLCTACENQQKGNDTPREYFARIGRPLGALEAFARHINNPRKSRRLLMENFTEAKEAEWKSRHLNDTRHVARLLKEHIERHIKSPHPDNRLFVQTRNGALTHRLRTVWGFGRKNRTKNDRHHGLDAILVAAATQAHVQAITSWHKHHRPNHKSHPGFYPPKPWANFRADALDAVARIFVSRQPRRKLTGALHGETIKSLRRNEKGEPFQVKKVRLHDLKPAVLDHLVDVQVTEGVARGRNAPLYHLLKDRLMAFDGQPDKAFAAPIHMPRKDGSLGPEIRSVKVITPDKSGMEVRGGIARNGAMAYVRIYQRDGKFYLCPVYIKDVMAGRLPDRLIVARKAERDWLRIQEGFTHLFDLYKHDYVRLTSRAGDALEGYYISTHRGVGSIKLRAHDRGRKDIETGVQNLRAFEKYHVTLMGELHKARK